MNNRFLCAGQHQSLICSTMLFTNHKGLATLQIIHRNKAMNPDLNAAQRHIAPDRSTESAQTDFNHRANGVLTGNFEAYQRREGPVTVFFTAATSRKSPQTRADHYFLRLSSL
jgi:spore germination cell wall hydrolase CwlJ-like protein